MAITGKFVADFASFLTAIDNAQLKLVDFGKGASSVETRLNNMVDNFSGRRIIQEASLMTIAIEKAGGIATLTGTELERVGVKADQAAEKLRKLGIDVPPGLQKVSDLARGAAEETLRLGEASKTASQGAGTGLTSLLGSATKLAGVFGIAFGAGQVISGIKQFTGEIFANADALTKLSDKTAISIEGLQRLQLAGDGAGNTIEDLTSAVNQMQKRLGGGDEGAVNGLERLGLNLAYIKTLQPDQQFVAIGEAIGKIADPMEQVAVGTAIFGKSFVEILPTIKAGFQDIKDGAVVASSEAIRAIDALGDRLGRLGRQAKAASSEFVGNLILGKGTGTGFEQVGEDFLTVTDEIERMSKAAQEARPHLFALKPTPELKDLGFSVEKAIEPLDKMQDRLKKVAEESKKAADAAKKAAEEHKKFTDSVTSLVSSAVGARSALGPYGTLIRDISERSGGFREHMDDLVSSFNEFHNGVSVAGDTLATVVIPAFSKLPDVVAQGTKAIKRASEDSTKSLHELSQEFVALAQIGGDNFGEVARGIGTFTVQMERMTSTDNLGDLKAYKAAWDELSGSEKAATAVMAGLQVASALVNKETKAGQVLSSASKGAAIGTSILPGYGTLIGAGVGALVGVFTSLEKKINPVREAFVQAAGGLAALNEKAFAATGSLAQVQALLSAKNAEQYKIAVDALNASFAIQDQAANELDAAMTKYGITLEEAGAKFRQGKLDEAFLELYKDQQVLTAGGVDFDLVLRKQAESFISLLQTSAATGASIPVTLKPAVERMKELGLFTDETGRDMVDLSKLTWAETLDKKILTLVESIQKLVDAIAGVPRQVSIGVDYDVQPFPGIPGTEGREPIYAAGGYEGMVSQPTLFVAGEAGPEHVSIGSGGGGGGGTPAWARELIDLMRGMPRTFRDGALGAAV